MTNKIFCTTRITTEGRLWRRHRDEGTSKATRDTLMHQTIPERTLCEKAACVESAPPRHVLRASGMRRSVRDCKENRPMVTTRRRVSTDADMTQVLRANVNLVSPNGTSNYATLGLRPVTSAHGRATPAREMSG